MIRRRPRGKPGRHRILACGLNWKPPASPPAIQVIHASRKKRIAAGSGTSVQDVNKLLKQHMQMADMMKRMSKLGQKGFMRSMGAMLPGMPGMPKL